MSDTKRLTNRNEQVAAMLADGEQLKNFYRFIAQNPHINLHDACQIIIERPNATVCFSFNEWAAMDRRVTKGRKGIAYYDNDGYKQFVFDANDTHGDNRYSRPILPMKRLLGGLDELNGTDLATDEQSDYRKIHKGIQLYLQEQDSLSGDTERDKLLIDGVTFSLYARTGFPKSASINMRGLPYSYAENAAFVKDVYILTDSLTQDIEEAYTERREEVKVIDDTDEETVSDEPIISVGQTEEKKIVETHSAIISNYKGYDILLRWTHPESTDRECEVYIGKRENYDNKGHYDNSDNSLMLISTNEKMFNFLSGSGWVLNQQEMIDEGLFTEQDYKEFYELENGPLKGFEKTGEIKFGIDIDKKDSGVPFRYPNWQDEIESVGQTKKEAEEPKHPMYPYYKRYMDAQKQYPKAIVFMRLGDFYEMLGDSAVIASKTLDLTLTGRDVGLPERVAMCGVPYHAMDKYLDKMLEYRGVVLIEPDKEPIYVLSHAEALGQSAESEKENVKPKITEIPDDEPTPFDDGQSQAEDWRSELIAELDETDDEQTEDYAELEDEEESDDGFDDSEPAEQDEVDDSDEPTEQPKDKVKSTPKKGEKGIKERKRKEKPQLSMFDLLNPQEKSRLEQIIEIELKYGSGVQHGKFRIFDKYNENPSEKAFEAFLKGEYGWGGHSGHGGTCQDHSQKGIKIYLLGEKGEELEQAFLKWPEVATRIADLIDDDNYLSEQEKVQYVKYKEEQNRLREQRLEQERRRNKFVEKVLTDEPRARKERIAEAYHNAESTEEFIGFVKNEYGAYSTKELDGQIVVINDYGVFVSENGDSSDMSSRYSASWADLEKKFASLIEANNYVEPLPQEEVISDLDAEEDDNWDTLIDARILKPAESEQAHEENRSENTDLNGVLDQTELGGVKTRFRNNVAAIKLVNRLYAENRNPTEAEKKVLSQFVGWGGLSQAFDENNEGWKKEYVELKGLLSTEDYEQARSSTLNAYYTAKDVIGGIYTALDRFGVKCNNRILEPSMGTGNFFGFMPKEIAEGSRLYGVELDNLTGRIAAKLYPQANVQIKGFEDTSFPNDKFDIVVGNVPFGGYGVADSAYNRYNFKVHDYFLAKSIDKVKPNGIVAIVTSKGTMDKLNPSARKYVAERAELIGAIRLPNTAFKQTAGTEAVADILFFRKRTERINADTENIEWLGTGKTDEGYEINNYFIKHPEMILGTLAEETGLYGGKDITVKPDGRELSEAIAEAVKNLPQGFYLPAENEPIEDEKEVDYNVKPMCYKADSGRLYIRVGDEMVEQRIPAFPKDAYQRLQGMIALREELHRILDIQIKGCSDEVLQEEQKRLNGMYDSFVKKYGEVNSQTNTRLFKDDGDAALLFACEDIDKETKKVSKAEIFYKRTIRPYIVPTNTDDCFEALQISKNERGRADIAYIEELTGKDYDTVLFELGDSVFRNPKNVKPDDKYSGFETAEEYLSGRVMDKLGEAEYYAGNNPEYKRNVTALEQVQPTPVTASEISVRLGATWIDKEYYQDFYCELVGVRWWDRGDINLYYNPFDSSWRLDQKDSVRHNTQMKQKEVFGTKRAPAYRLFIDAMNMRATTIYDTVVDENGNERRVVNQPETIAAREKQNRIKELFSTWIYAKPERREELEATYNSLFNKIKLPSYDGSYLKFPEMNPAIELNPHQKNAVHRIISSPDSTLLHHVVGSGKTYTMVASIMKMRQLGICNKAMVAVPNHLVEQWAGEWRKLYPNAKILVATKEDLEKDNRQKFVSKVAFGYWDGIIIAQSSFAKIPVSQDRQIKKLREEIKLIEETVERQWMENGMPRGAVKNLERIKKSREAMLKKLMDGNKKDDVLTFENLGIDYLYIDEAHYYKNLYLFTKMNNVAGVSNAASARASDIKLKCEYLQELHGSDRGIVFGTGTPISNSMSEMYTMQNYLQPKALAASGITFFDGWAADFGETTTSMELSPSGQGYRARTRFAKFTNLPELLTMYRSFADVQTADMVKLAVPEAEKHVINLKPSDTVIALAEQIAERADKIHQGLVSPYEDNMLKITSDGKKLALDPRCFVPESEDEEGSKLNVASEYIREIWERTLDFNGTQIVFCDLSTPKKRFDDYEYGTDFDAYNDLKYKLVQRGIPKDEIAFIHDAKTDEEKQDLFDKVNSGAIRILIGSTEKCGAGTNVQKRLVALHHLDTPYRPSDLEQREGRIIRQGNENKKVDIYTYVTERTFDSYSYQILENKQKFISQINKGDLTVREAEDIDETTLSYAEIKAITAANPKIKRKMEVDAEIARLRVLEGQYKKNLYELQDKIRKDFPEDIRKQELLIERVTLDLMHLQSSKPENPEAFEISVNGTVYTDKKEGGKALTEALYKSKPETAVAEYRGFKISMNPITILTATEREITLTANGQYTLTIGESASGNLTRLENFIEDFPKRKERLENRLKQLKDDLEIAKEQVEKPFEHKEHLLELLSEQTELNAELDLDKKDEIIAGDDEETDDDNYRALPTQRNNKEDNDIIDKEDKTALMQVEILPDYSVVAKDMHEHGYFWDGMLPMRKDAAKRAFERGVQVYILGKDDTEREAEVITDFEDGLLFGVEKPVWKMYLESEHGRAYMAARSQFAEAAGVVASGEMDSIDERFTIDFIETNYEERADLDEYLAEKPNPTAEAMKAFMPQLMDEYTERIWRDELKYYGWEKDSVKRSIGNHIENAELKVVAQEMTKITFDAEKELNIILGGKTEQEIEDMNLPVFSDDLTVVEKEPAYLLNESKSVKKYAEGLMLLHNNVTGDWYVINDTSARGKDGKELKVGDTTDVMTILAYNGLYDGNPLREFRDGREARNYYDEKVKAIRAVKANSTDFEEAVINSVWLEFDDYKKDLMSKSPQTVFENSYKTHLYNEFSEVIQYGKEYLSDKEFEALYADRGHILNSLFDDYVGSENYSVETYSDTALFIKDYCESEHNEIYYPTTYYGKDTENRAYYSMTKGISIESLRWFDENTDADMITIAAPACYVEKSELEKRHIFYLNIGRDIQADELIGQEAMGNMMNAMDNYYRIYPLYLQTGEYAHEHYEIIDHRNSRKSNIECKLAIEDAIRQNFDGMHLNEGFEEKIIEQFGMERVAFVVANTVNEREWDGRFSRENKDWAKTIPISEDENVRSECCLETHPAVLDAFINRIRRKIKENSEENKEMAQDKYKNFTARGDKVLSIVKDRDDRNIAIIQRKNDFVVAARYDTTDGTWGQGIYDFKTLEAAEKYREEKYSFENTSDTVDKKWLTCKVSPEALIKKYQVNSRFMMPKGSGYEGYAYSIFNDRIKEGTITTDLKSDTRERALVIRIPDNQNVELRSGEKTVEIEPHEFVSLVNETTSDKYEREQRYTVGFPHEAFIKEYENSMLLAMPNDTKYKGYVYYLPQSVITEDKYSDDGTLIANIGESFKITLRKGEERVELSAKEYAELVGDKKADKYGRDDSEMNEYREQQSEDDKKWSTFAVSENSVIANYENSTLFKMPKGEYAGFVYYIPSGMVRKDENGLSLRIPEDFTAHLKDGDEKKDLSAQEFIAAIESKTDEDYESVYRAPSEEAKAQFAKVEAQLRRNVPEEMRNKPNWVVVRTRENNDTGRLDKFLISPHTGKFAESDNPETWADFDTACKYAKENGGVCLAYALDGKDGIACIDLDGCMQENGDFSDIAQKAFVAASGSYAEKSVSGKGLHIFGKTKGADLRSFSKDKTMEYYQGGHFIAMTGDYYGSSELHSFDTPEMQSVLTSKLEKRTEWKNTGKGVEGLSSMDDREMLDRAFKAKNGDTVKRLYNGEDLRGNHSNSDMSLMNYLAFWSNHDIDQMLRVFSTSGLYRSDKPQSYYEHTAIKAVKGTPVYTPPKASNTNKPSGNGSGNGKGGK